MNKKRLALKRRLRRGRARSNTCTLERCGLFGFKSLGPLAAVLWQSTAGIRALANAPQYAEWKDLSKPLKPRAIQDPRGDTEKIHYRIYELLDRVSRPDFLHSATRGRSITTNARAHAGRGSCVTTDMKDCYGSTTTQHVARFFERDLRLAPDLAWKIARICSVNGHLPTGSCLSPLLAYWAHRETFDYIAALCAYHGVVMTLYVDDLTLSGPHASLALLHRVKRLLASIGLKTHKDKSFSSSAYKHITGVVVGKGAVHIPNKRLHRIVRGIDALAVAPPPDRKRAAQQVVGGIASTAAISRRVARGLHARLQRLVRD